MEHEIGKTYWIIESKCRPREVILKRKDGNLGIVKFKSGGGIRIPLSRLLDYEQVESIIEGNKTKRSPYDYMH